MSATTYQRWLEEHGLTTKAPPYRDRVRQIEEIERLADKKLANSKHSPDPFSKRRALEKVDRYDDLAAQMRREVPRPTAVCRKCGGPLSHTAYPEDPCGACRKQPTGHNPEEGQK